MDLWQCPVVVTGAASGLGAETARHLAEEGARVALIDIDAPRVEAVARQSGGLAIPCDVSDTDATEAALAQAREAHGLSSEAAAEQLDMPMTRLRRRLADLEDRLALVAGQIVVLQPLKHLAQTVICFQLLEIIDAVPADNIERHQSRDLLDVRPSLLRPQPARRPRRSGVRHGRRWPH